MIGVKEEVVGCDANIREWFGGINEHLTTIIHKVEEELERNAIDEERRAKYIGESEAINKELDRLEQFNIKVDVRGFIKHKHMFFLFIVFQESCSWLINQCLIFLNHVIGLMKITMLNVILSYSVI